MKTKFLIGLLILGIVLISGCIEKECETASDCTDKTCFAVECKNNNCIYSSISDCCGNEKCEPSETYESCVADCPNCDDKNNCTIDEYDYHEQKCINTPILDTVCCGNSLCEIGETYLNCARDCPNCDDDTECTIDSYDYHKQECINGPIIPCCGNGICDEGAETYLNCSTDCPNCDDNNRLTGDSFNYITQECEYIEYYYFEDFNGGSTSWVPSTEKGPDPRWVIVFPENDTNGVLTMADGVEYAFGSFGERDWTDYTLRLKVKLEEGGVEISVRTMFGEEGAYGISVSDNQIRLDKDIEPRINFVTKDYDFGLGEFHEVAIAVKGNNIKVYVDDNLEIDYTDDDNPIMTGHLALYTNRKNYFDDIIVEAPR